MQTTDASVWIDAGLAVILATTLACAFALVALLIIKLKSADRRRRVTTENRHLLEILREATEPREGNRS